MLMPTDALAGPNMPHLEVQIGDIWWLPEELAVYPGGKSRFCLVVAFETPLGSRNPARAHYVVGSTRSGGPPEIVLEPGETSLRERTYFRFWWSGGIAIATLVTGGRFRGRLDRTRQEEIGVAIRTSKRAALKRLVEC